MANDAGPGTLAAYLYTGEGSIPRDVEEVEVHPSMTEITDGLFVGYHWLRSLLLRASLLKIGEQAFNGCLSLRGFRCLTTVPEIGRHAFWGCSNLAEIVLPS